MSISAYRRTIANTESPKEIERRILTRINATLKTYHEQFDALGARSDRQSMLSGVLQGALSDNVKFWSALRTDLVSPANAYPEDLRGNLINLSLFVERHTAKILGGEGEISVLVDINKSIIAGMSGIGEAA